LADTILIVEDERIIALDIEMQVNKTEFSIFDSVSSGEEALALLNRGSLSGTLPSLVLMDVNLAGEMDGAETAGMIKEQYDIPVVILTAYEDDETLRRVTGSDPFAYLVKPVSGRQLEIAITLALYRHEMGKKIREKDRQLAHSQRMEAIGRMSAGLAHEYNNLVTVMMGYLRLLQDDLDALVPELQDGGKDEQMLGEIRKNTTGLTETVRRAGALSRQLLSFTRIKSLQIERLRVGTIIDTFQKMIESILPDGIELHLQVDHPDATIRAEAARIENALINMFLNARDAIHKKGTVSFRAVANEFDEPVQCFDGVLPAGKYVTFRVTDDGAGIDNDVLPNIFEPFYTTKDQGYGTGFGLASVYSTVTELGGGITVSSEPGVGTEFCLYIPRAE
jgi:signal transduction histidine kinase